MVKDWLFGTALFALVAYSGHALVGDVEGIALWRVFFLAGAGGFLFGYQARIRREEATYQARHRPRRKPAIAL